MRQLFLSLVFACSFFFQSEAQQETAASDSAELVITINGFVKAFSSLNWEAFTAYFADNATAFFPPSAKFPYRANNKTDVLNMFRKVFDNAQKMDPAAPHIDIQPEELKIQMAGTVAITSFLLHDPGMLGRRTIVWQKTKGAWLIIHLHASGIAI